MTHNDALPFQPDAPGSGARLRRSAASRQSEVMQLLVQQGAVSVPDLAVKFAVSEMTIRRDLMELEQPLPYAWWGGFTAERKRSGD